MLVARVHKEVPCASLTSVRRTGRGGRSQCRTQGHSGPEGQPGGEVHRQGEPETEASTDGPSEGPAEGHAPGTGCSFLPWALESGASSGLETVLSAALSGVEEFRFSRKSCAARVQVARGRTQRRQRLSQSGPCPALSGGWGAMQTSRMGFLVL